MTKAVIRRLSDGAYLALECRGAKWFPYVNQAYPFDTEEEAQKHLNFNIQYKTSGYDVEQAYVVLLTEDNTDLCFNKALELMSKLQRGCDCEYDHRCGNCDRVLDCLEFVKKNR